MSDVRHPVPSHSPPDRTQVSRVVAGFAGAAGVTVAVAVAGFSNQGLVNRQAAAHTPEQHVLQSRVLFKPAASASQNVGITQAAETDAAQILVPFHQTVEADAAQTLDVDKQRSVAQAAETDQAQKLVPFQRALETDAAQALSFELGEATPPPKILRAVDAHSPPGRQPVSQLIFGLRPALTVTAAAETDEARPLTIAAPPVVPPAPALQGHTNQGRVYRQVPVVPAQEAQDPIPRVYVYVHSAPPIFNVITQGGTNQGYKFKAGPQPARVERDLGSRLFKARGPQFRSLTAAVETDAAQALDVTGPQQVFVTKATETDLAKVLLPFVRAHETDTARTVDVDKQRGVVNATETNAAQALDKDKAVTLVRAAQTEAARTLTMTKQLAVTRALELDTAPSIGGTPVVGHFDQPTPAGASDPGTPAAGMFDASSPGYG